MACLIVVKDCVLIRLENHDMNFIAPAFEMNENWHDNILSVPWIFSLWSKEQVPRLKFHWQSSSFLGILKCFVMLIVGTLLLTDWNSDLVTRLTWIYLMHHDPMELPSRMLGVVRFSHKAAGELLPKLARQACLITCPGSQSTDDRRL